jgi:hypothetical protein
MKLAPFAFFLLVLLSAFGNTRANLRPVQFDGIQAYEFLLAANSWAQTLKSVEDLIPIVLQYGQNSSQYVAQTLVIKSHFQPNIVLNIDGEVFIGADAVIGSLTQPGSLPHPNPTPLPEYLNAIVPLPFVCSTFDVSFRADYVPAFGTSLVGGQAQYQLQVVQTQIIDMQQRCNNGVWDRTYLLNTLNVTNSLVIPTSR